MSHTWITTPAIKAKIKEVISGADYGSYDLNGVITTRKTDNRSFNPPVIWVSGDRSPIDDTSFALSEDWKMKFVIAAIVKGYDPEPCEEQAEKMALIASAELLKDRTLGGLASDLIRTAWIPGHELSQQDKLFAAAVEIEVRFLTREG